MIVERHELSVIVAPDNVPDKSMRTCLLLNMNTGPFQVEYKPGAKLE